MQVFWIQRCLYVTPNSFLFLVINFKKAGTDQCGSVGWDVSPQSKKSLVQFPVRAHDWVVGLVPGGGTYQRQPTDVSLHQCFSPSLSPSFPLSLGITFFKKVDDISRMDIGRTKVGLQF